jgi:thiosulfate/3-mercaptopyruvate sulfurtransferase
MKQIITCFLFFASYQAVQARSAPIFVSPEWLHQHQHDEGLVIIQVNSLRLDYNLEHIEVARFLWPGWLAPDSPEGSMNAPELKSATAIIRSLGINNNSHVIVCHVRNEVSVAARMFLMLEYLGLKGNVSFLNGGLEAWKKLGYTVTQTVPRYKPGTFKAKPQPILVDRHFLQNNLNSEKIELVDARMKRFYDGDPSGLIRDGHIPGAKNIPYTELVDGSNQFKPLEELGGYFKPVITDKNHEIVTYCFIGQTASVVYLAGRALGYNMKLYDGSLQEWTRIPELPLVKTESTNTTN